MLLMLQGCSYIGLYGGDKEAKPEPGAEDVFREGEDLLAKGKYDQARQAYAKVKEHDPEKFYDPLVQIRLGDSYYEEGRYDEAGVEYQRFLDMRPHNKAAAYVKYQLGMCNFKQIGKPDRDPRFAMDSVKHFSELLRDYPDNTYSEEAGEKLRIAKSNLAEHEYVVGIYYMKRGSYTSAVKRFKGIKENYPGSKVEPDTLYALADAYIRLGQYDPAKSTLAALYQEYPTHELSEKAREDLAPEIPAGQ